MGVTLPAADAAPVLIYRATSLSTPAHDQPSSAEFLDDTGLPYISGGTRLSGTVVEGGGTTQAGAIVGPGYIRVGSETRGFANAGVVSSAATAGFSDSFVIDVPSLRGVPAVSLARIGIVYDEFLQGSVAGVGNMRASADLDVFLGNSSEYFFRQVSLSSGGGFEEAGEMPREIVVPFSYVIGQPIDVSIGVSVVTTISSQPLLGGVPGVDHFAQGTAFANFPTSIHWLGLEGLPEGATVRGSFDWSGPAAVVPLPAAAWLFATAVLSLGLAARRRSGKGGVKR